MINNPTFQPYKPKLGLVFIFILLAIIFGLLPFLGFLFHTYYTDSHLSWWKMVVSLLWMIFTAILMVYFVYRYAYQQRGQYFDQTFLPLGLKGEKYLYTSRQYHGDYRNHKIHVYLQPTQRTYSVPVSDTDSTNLTTYTGDRLEIFIEHPFKTRLGISDKKYKPATAIDQPITPLFYRLLKKTAKTIIHSQAQDIDLPRPPYQNYSIAAIDPEWAKKILNQEEIKKNLAPLLSFQQTVGVKIINFGPAALQFVFTTDINNINPDQFKKILDCLFGIIENIKKMNLSPSVTAEESENERLSRTERNKMFKKYRWVTWLVLGGCLGLPALFTLLLFALIIFMESK